MSRRVPSIAVAVLVTVWLCALVGAQSSPSQAVPPVSFTTDVRPILERSCLSCHGDAVQMGKLDLRSREGALRGGTRGSDLIPGDSGGSRLYRRVAGLEQPAMPVQGDPLTAAQVATLKNWIDQGAAWDAIVSTSNAASSAAAALAALENRPITPEERNYWAFKLPVQAPLPVVGNTRLTNPIDRFLESCASGARSDRRAAGRSLHAGPPRLSRPARPAANAGAGRRVRRGSVVERVGAPHRQSARLAALRRTLRPPLARRRALCGLGRVRVRHAPAQRVALPRLRHRVVQRRQAVQPVPDRTAGRRRNGRPDRRQPHRHRVPPHGPARAVSRERQPRAPLRLPRRNHRHDRERHARTDGQLRALPQPQVRSDFTEGLLRARGVPLRLRRNRGPARAQGRGGRLPVEERGDQRAGSPTCERRSNISNSPTATRCSSSRSRADSRTTSSRSSGSRRSSGRQARRCWRNRC